MKTLKLSYSILDAWSSSNFEQAVAYYLGKDFPATDAMELGRLKHEIWAKHTLDTGELHDDFGGGTLTKPVVEQKYEKYIPFNDEWQILLRGRLDLSHDEFGSVTVEDYKCGKTPASQHVDKLQLDYYKLLVPQATLGRYRCFNPYTEQVTVGIKYLDVSNAEAALEHIITFGGEMLDYLQSQRLARDYAAGDTSNGAVGDHSSRDDASSTEAREKAKTTKENNTK